MKTPEPSPNLAVERPRSRWRVARLRVWHFRRSLRPQWASPKWVALLVAGVVMPTVCFAVGFPLRPRWQLGGLGDYAQVLLSRSASCPQYPFLLYSMACMTLLLYAPETCVKRFAVRFGIYTGVLQAGLYSVIFFLALYGSNTHMIPASPSTAIRLYVALGATLGVLWWFRRFKSLVNWAAGVWILAGVIHDGVFIMISWALYYFLCAAPCATICYAAMAVYAARHNGVARMQFSLKQLLAVVTWTAAFCGAWRLSVIWMLEEYARLPAPYTSP